MGFIAKIRKALAESTDLGIKKVGGDVDNREIAQIVEGGTSTPKERAFTDIDPLLAYKSVSYYVACVNAITSAVKKVPIKIIDEQTQKPMTDEQIQKNSEARFINSFLTYPGKSDNKKIFWPRFIERWLLNRYVFGASYFQLLAGDDRESAGKWVGLHVLKRPDKMEVVRDDSGKIIGYKWVLQNGKEKNYGPEELKYLMKEGPESDDDAQSPIESLAASINLLIGARQFDNANFKNGPKPSWILTFDNPLRDKQFKRLILNLQQMALNAGRSLILEGKGAKAENSKIAQGQIEASYRGLSDDLKGEIEAVTGCMPVMIGDPESMTYHNASLQKEIFWQNTGESLLSELMYFLSYDVFQDFFPEWAKDGRDNYQPLSIWYDEEYIKQQYQDPELDHTRNKDMVADGAMTRNQWREARGMQREENIPEMDQYMVGQNILPLSTETSSMLEELDVDDDADADNLDDMVSDDQDSRSGDTSVEN